MTADTKETILTAAKTSAQAHGYNGLSFRELAKDVGIKSASIHYYFPTKGDLGAALAGRYTATASEGLARILAEATTPAVRMARYTAIFRKALENGNRMCLCAIMAAQHDDLPPAVRAEIETFADVNVAWLAKVLAPVSRTPKQRALAIFAAIGGAQLTARSRNDIKVFDAIIESYRANGLIP